MPAASISPRPTNHPRPAKYSPIARPIPDPPPVMKIALRAAMSRPPRVGRPVSAAGGGLLPDRALPLDEMRQRRAVEEHLLLRGEHVAGADRRGPATQPHDPFVGRVGIGRMIEHQGFAPPAGLHLVERGHRTRL